MKRIPLFLRDFPNKAPIPSQGVDMGWPFRLVRFDRSSRPFLDLSKGFFDFRMDYAHAEPDDRITRMAVKTSLVEWRQDEPEITPEKMAQALRVVADHLDTLGKKKRKATPRAVKRPARKRKTIK